MPQSDRVAIVTGGAKGIGAACARRFAEAGMRVVIADIEEDAGEALAKDLDAGKGRALFVDCDVSDKLAVNNLLAETRSAFDRVDVLINNAAVLAEGSILDLEMADFDKVMSVNLRGAFLVARAVARQIVEQIEEEGMRAEDCRKRYAIVNMSSVAGFSATPVVTPYACSKHALEALTEGLRRELAMYGIDCVAINPGPIATPIWDKAEMLDIERYRGTDYERAIETILKFMLERGQAGLPPAAVAKAIHRALTAKRPKLNTVITPEGWRHAVLSRLPRRLTDRLITKALKLTPGDRKRAKETSS